MNEDILAGKWKQMKGEIKSWWGRLTDDDVDQVEGRFDVLSGILQERYGYSRQQAEDEINRRVAEYDTHHRDF